MKFVKLKARLINGRQLRPAALLAVTLLAVVVAAQGAQAGFPGSNGVIAYGSSLTGCSPNCVSGDTEIWATSETESGWRAVRLSTNFAVDEQPAVSPNGKEIAFQSTRNNNEFPNPGRDRELYVMDAKDDDGDGQGDNLRRLTDNAVPDTNVAWSPDGKKLAFRSTTESVEIYVIDADGSVAEDGSELPPEIVLPRPPDTVIVAHPVFSPDGEWIVFVGGYGRVNSSVGPSGANPPVTDLDLFITRADGSGPVTKLTNTPASTADAPTLFPGLEYSFFPGETHPDFSPDGTKLAFMSNRDYDGDGLEDDTDIYVMNVLSVGLDGAVRVTPESPSNVPVNLTDSMIDVDPISGYPVLDPSTHEPTRTNERWPAWSPDGTQIAVWSGTGLAATLAQRPGIWSVDADAQTDSARPEPGAPVRIVDPSINPVPSWPDWGPAPTKPN